MESEPSIYVLSIQSQVLSSEMFVVSYLQVEADGGGRVEYLEVWRLLCVVRAMPRHHVPSLGWLCKRDTKVKC